MLDTPNDSKLLDQLDYYKSENNSLKVQLQECLLLIQAREQTVRMFQEVADSDLSTKSLFDMQQQELLQLKDFINRLQETASSNLQRETEMEKQLNNSAMTEMQLQVIQEQSQSLQLQLESMQQDLMQLQYNLNQELQNNSKLTELESLLQMAQEEIELLKYNR